LVWDEAFSPKGGGLANLPDWPMLQIPKSRLRIANEKKEREMGRIEESVETVTLDLNSAIDGIS
jgi:hypothetical protein